MMKKNVCQYCGKTLPYHQQFCNEQCAFEYDQKIAKDYPKIKYFIFGIVIGVVALFLGSFQQSDFYVGSGMIIIGITIVLWPLTTPETMKMLGYKKARILGRILGIMCFIFGIGIIIF